jgi:glycosyltransferase involved in cell wall biosynthesis
MTRSLSIIVPAFNEENNLRMAIEKYERVAKELFKDYELIIVNDGSSDNTGMVADEIGEENQKVSVRHHLMNQGLGAAFKSGLEEAVKEYCILLSGEGDPAADGVRNILCHAGEADMVVSYIGNPEIRPVYRRFITWTMTSIINVRYGLHMKYYSGFVLYKTAQLKELDLESITSSSAYQAEIITKLLRRGKSYVQVPYEAMKTKGSSIIKPKNILRVGGSILKMVMNK